MPCNLHADASGLSLARADIRHRARMDSLIKPMSDIVFSVGFTQNILSTGSVPSDLCYDYLPGGPANLSAITQAEISIIRP